MSRAHLRRLLAWLPKRRRGVPYWIDTTHLPWQIQPKKQRLPINRAMESYPAQCRQLGPRQYRQRTSRAMTASIDLSHSHRLGVKCHSVGHRTLSHLCKQVRMWIAMDRRATSRQQKKLDLALNPRGRRQSLRTSSLTEQTRQWIRNLAWTTRRLMVCLGQNPSRPGVHQRLRSRGLARMGVDTML